jgi:hypothetical protein
MQMWKSMLLRGTMMAAALGLPGQALAGWGDDAWGTMVWWLPVSVPAVGGLALVALALGLGVTARRVRRGHEVSPD